MLMTNSKEKTWKLGTLDIAVYGIFLIKTLFFTSTILHLILLNIDSHSFDDLHEFVDALRNACEFLFRASMSFLLL